ncbi:MAG: VCBS repeat-containing protein [Proteobacteria bacterium]|nr:VCBS repeat-containing protein [Pseudomonadota bacterium]
MRTLAFALLLGCQGADDDGDSATPEQLDFFVPATEGSGLESITHLSRNALDGTAIASGDLDQDGFMDLVFAPGLRSIEVAWGSAAGFTRDAKGLPAHAASALSLVDLDGDGLLELVTAETTLRVFTFDGGFTERTDLALDGLDVTDAVDILPLDIDLDGRLDLHIGRWGPANLLLVQSPSGSFAASSLIDSPVEESWTATWADLTGDGSHELFVATDTRAIDYGIDPPQPDGPLHDRLWVHNDGSWTDQAAALGLDTPRSSMGGLPIDLDRDGTLDLWVPNLGRSHAMRFDGQAFTHGEDALGLATAVRTDEQACNEGGDLRSCLLVSWASHYDDVDGDGIDDLLVLNGGLEEDWRGPQPPTLFFGDGESYSAASLTPTAPARSLVPADIDGDGALDLVIGTHNADVEVWRNPTPLESLRAQLVSHTSAPQGRGAVLTLTWPDRQRELPIGAGGVAMTSLDPSIVLQGAVPSTAEVRWPTGLVQTVQPSRDMQIEEPPLVSVSANAILADGATKVIVEVEPHDATGALGTGQTVQIDADLGTWTAPVQDLGDGRYRRTLTSPSSPGETRIRVSWNDFEVRVQPRVEFTSP